MIALLAGAFALSTLLVIALCVAASKPAPSSSAPRAEDVKQACLTGQAFNNPESLRSA